MSSRYRTEDDSPVDADDDADFVPPDLGEDLPVVQPSRRSSGARRGRKPSRQNTSQARRGSTRGRRPARKATRSKASKYEEDSAWNENEEASAPVPTRRTRSAQRGAATNNDEAFVVDEHHEGDVALAQTTPADSVGNTTTQHNGSEMPSPPRRSRRAASKKVNYTGVNVFSLKTASESSKQTPQYLQTTSAPAPEYPTEQQQPSSSLKLRLRNTPRKNQDQDYIDSTIPPPVEVPQRKVSIRFKSSSSSAQEEGGSSAQQEDTSVEIVEDSPAEELDENATIAQRTRKRKRSSTNSVTYVDGNFPADDMQPRSAGTQNDPDFAPPPMEEEEAQMDDDYYWPQPASKRRRSNRSSRQRRSSRKRRSTGRSVVRGADEEYVNMDQYSDDEELRNGELYDEDFDVLQPPLDGPGITIRRPEHIDADQSDNSDSDDQIKLRDRNKLRKRRPLFSRPRSKKKPTDRYDRLLHMASQLKKSPSKFHIAPSAGTVGVNFPSLRNAASKSGQPKKMSLNYESSSSDDEDMLPTGRQERGGKDNYSHLMPINQSDFDGKKSSKHKPNGDLDPVTIDENVTFDSIGGLDEHIRGLKEMVLLPLMYPEIFQKFQLNPPKGVIFCGPPGCGKTLMARAIANMCKKSSGRPIAFFMRKGADILSKWVGEAEKQLRMLFEQATKMQPSIIFFDEIDGLAPVRSSKQDYIHSSIVSTLLALMDGLDNRGQVIVIGATNRVDAIDPALRRPGRFDRELFFKLPDEPTRKKILEIHTKHWNPPLDEDIKNVICRKTVGYCGADIKSLCSETALRALRRVYPQIYESKDKLAIDLQQIRVEEQDFNSALQDITPSYHRSTVVHSSPLPGYLHACLSEKITELNSIILKIFPVGNSQRGATSTVGFSVPVHRPWFLLYGEEGMGQTEISKALLHYSLSNLPMISLSYNTLMSSEMSNRTVEASLIDQIAEAKRQSPSVIYIPNIDEWWTLFHQNPIIIHSLISMLSDIPSGTPVFVMATSNVASLVDLPDVIQKIFAKHSYQLTAPSEENRRSMWEHFIKQIKKPAISKQIHLSAENAPQLPVLPKASETPQHNDRMAEARRKEEKKRFKEEEKFIRDLRITLRDCVVRVLGDRRFNAFRKPSVHHTLVDNEEPRLIYVLDILEKLEDFEYTTVEEFMDDFKEMVQNAEHYHSRPGARSDFAENRQRLASTASQLYEVLKSFVDSIPRNLKRRCRDITRRRQQEKENELLRLSNESTTNDASDSTPNQSSTTPPSNMNGNADSTTSTETSAARSNPDGPIEVAATLAEPSVDTGNPSTSSLPNGGSSATRETEDLTTIVSDELLDELREGLVATTVQYSVTQLDELYSFVMGILYRHRFEKHRDAVVREIQQEVNNFTSSGLSEHMT